MEKRDIIASLIIGEISAWFILAVFKNLLPAFDAWIFWLLPIVFPLLCLLGMAIATLIGKKIPVLYQFAKFFLVGGMNTLVDLGILNLLIFVSSIASGIGYSGLKGISFFIALVNSYFWNKNWTFSERTDFWNKFWTFETGKQKVGTAEFGQFLAVSLIGLLINVGMASIIVNLVGPQFNLNAKTWANVGALFGSMAGLMWNFVGYKFVVFKK